MPDVFMPRLSDTMTEGRINTWLKQEGDDVARGEVIAEIETDKAVMELESYESGVLTRIIVGEGDTAPIGEPIAVIGDEAPGAGSPAKSSPAAAPPPPVGDTSETPAGRAEIPSAPAPAAGDSRVRATPLVRRLARDHGLDLGTVAGSGPGGRIVRADIEALLEERPAGQQATRPTEAAAQPATQPAAQPGAVTPVAAADVEVPLSNIRRITAERLTVSAAAPHFHLTVAVDAGPLLQLRRQLNEQVFEEGARCSVNDLLVRAVAVNLAQHREVNASWGGDRLVQHGRVDIGIAVAVEAGLIVPVVRDADHKSLVAIAAETRVLAERARAGRLTPDEFNGGTFTISNLGMFGIEQFTAVINPPQAAILAVGAAREEPVVREGGVVVQPTMRLTLTSDHRVLDGATSAAFLQDLVGLLEQPLRVLA